jgi:hypothetical protein
MLYVASFESRISVFFSTLFLFASLLARTRTRRETWSCTHMEVPGCLLKPPPLGRAGRRYSSVVVAGTDPGPRVSSLLLSRLGSEVLMSETKAGQLQLGSAPWMETQWQKAKRDQLCCGQCHSLASLVVRVSVSGTDHVSPSGTTNPALDLAVSGSRGLTTRSPRPVKQQPTGTWMRVPPRPTRGVQVTKPALCSPSN